MNRFAIRRGIIGCWGLLVALASHEALAVGIHDYHPVRTFSLPLPNAESGGNVLFDPLPDGRLLLLNGTHVSLESAPASGTFLSLGTIPGFNLSFGPSFLAVSPDGTRAAAGSNGHGSVVVFNTADPTDATSFAIQDFNGEWIDNQLLAIANAAAGNGVQVLNTANSVVTSLITNVGGATAGIAFDAAGNLYTGNGFSFGTGSSDTGWVKAFAASAWQNALATNSPLDFEAIGTPIADLLSATPLGFDGSGNLLVGGADFFGNSGDFGYAALVDAAAIADVLANPQATPPITPISAGSVLRKIASPQDTIDFFQSPYWNFNHATGELYLGYFQSNAITVYAVPEPASITLLLLATAMPLVLRHRKRVPSALATAVAFLGLGSAALASSPYAAELISQNAAFGSASIYNDPMAVLGEPTRIATNFDSTQFHVKIVEAALNRDLADNNILTTLSRKSDGIGGFLYGSITVKFDHPVRDDPANPYGIDLNVFGNAFYVGSGFSDDTTDMRTYLAGGIFAEPVVVSVSPDNVAWYTYTTGPYGDTAFPTQGHVWSAEQFDLTSNGWTTETTDFTKPVNPTLNAVLGVVGQPIAAADAMAAYVGAGGGSGFDLAESGFDWIQYVRVESTAQFLNGEIDAFADVRPMRVGDALSITPANVAAATPLSFQHLSDESRTAVVANFTEASELAKLTTATVSDAAALAALAGNPLATYQLDVLSLIGASAIEFVADYHLSPGLNYAGDGSNLAVIAWDGSAWQGVPSEFDSLSGLVQLTHWTDASATLVITQNSGDELPGDFNRDNTVDAADYTVWRNGLGSQYDQDDYLLWKNNFGMSLPGGGGNLAIETSTVPEPAAALLAAIGLVAGLSQGRLAA